MPTTSAVYAGRVRSLDSRARNFVGKRFPRLGTWVARHDRAGRHIEFPLPAPRRGTHKACRGDDGSAERIAQRCDEGGAVAGQMVAADMTRPPTATRNPVGRVTEVLGAERLWVQELRVAEHTLEERFQWPLGLAALALFLSLALSPWRWRAREEKA